MDLFFCGIRASIIAGTFSNDVLNFQKVYEHELPEFKGQGPRVRGYHLGGVTTKGEVIPKKRNLKPYKNLAENATAESIKAAALASMPSVDTVDDSVEKVAESLEVQGLGEEGFGSLYDED